MALWVLRFIFTLVAAGVAVTLFRTTQVHITGTSFDPFIVFALVMLAAFGIVAADFFLPRKRIDLISSVYFGLVVGLFLTYLLVLALTPLFPALEPNVPNPVLGLVNMVLSVVISYICISLLMQTKDDLRFIIPYVEFAKEVKGLQPYILDTSVVIDGRIADVIETGCLDNQLIMPRFVLNELQHIADSSDKLRRARGRRGLDILNRLRNNKDVDLKIHDRETPNMANQPVDMKLVLLAKHLEGKLVTGDYNLNKVARIHSVPVINLNDIANSLKPLFLPGEDVQVRLVKAGEESGQGVGYLDDGTMIVVENGRSYVGRVVKIAVTSVLQTSAGRMIFGRFEETVVDAENADANSRG